jgi:hypothetical protein
MERFTGLSVSLDAFKASTRRREELNRLSAVVADLLERAGVTVTGARLAAIGLVTQQSLEVPSYRAIQIIPAVAARDRAPIAASLCYHLQNLPCGRVTSLVVTTKERCNITGLRGSITALGRQVSRWSSIAKSRWGIDVLLRVTEYTIRESVDPSGPAYFVHAHIIALVPNTWLTRGDERLAECLTWSKRTLGIEILDHDVVHDREAMVRYCLKPLFMSGSGDPAHLPRTPDEAVALAEAVANLKLVQPLGSFKEFRSRLETDGLKAVRIVDEEGSPYELVERRTRPAGHNPKERLPKDTRGTNRIRCVILPIALHTRYREPIAIVDGYDPTTFAPPTRVGSVATTDLPGIWRRNGAPEPGAAVAEAAAAAHRGKTPTASAPRHRVLTGRSTVPPDTPGDPLSARTGFPRSTPQPTEPPRGGGGGLEIRDSTPGVLP